jgi:hypothetical protein
MQKSLHPVFVECILMSIQSSKEKSIMDNKTKGIIGTIAAVLLCGCPGLFLCVFGAATAFGGGTYSLGSDSGNIPPTMGYVFLCLSIILIIIPVVVGFFMLRKKPEASTSTSSNQPLPPTS